MSQHQLGRAVGVGFQQIHKYECGASQISVSRLWHIAAAMGCNVSYFFDGFDEQLASVNGGLADGDT